MVAGAGDFRLGGWLVQPRLNRISRGKTEVHLRPRLVDVLRLVTGIDLRVEYRSVERIVAQGIPLPFPLEEHLVYSGARITRIVGFSYMPFLEGMRATYEWYSRTGGGKR